MAERDAPAPRFAYKADRLKPLRALCQVARLWSVSRAAEALYLSQQAVILQLQALERDLGAPFEPLLHLLDTWSIGQAR